MAITTVKYTAKSQAAIHYIHCQTAFVVFVSCNCFGGMYGCPLLLGPGIGLEISDSTSA